MTFRTSTDSGPLIDASRQAPQEVLRVESAKKGGIMVLENPAWNHPSSDGSLRPGRDGVVFFFNVLPALKRRPIFTSSLRDELAWLGTDPLVGCPMKNNRPRFDGAAVSRAYLQVVPPGRVGVLRDRPFDWLLQLAVKSRRPGFNSSSSTCSIWLGSSRAAKTPQRSSRTKPARLGRHCRRCPSSTDG
jgi:hypothetical protein